ncbi:MAG: dihydroorotase family protein [Candidatus Bathyarchaeota archaeon]|nr:dihydroorotase family protein [Candidatus Bathyarchaeota archaeon]
MPVDAVIKNGTLVLPSGLWEGSLVIDEGRIIGVMKSGEPKADRVIDALGKFVLPGMVDMHVHLRDPGNPDRENFESGTRAAAAGGVTSVMDMPNTVPATVTVKAFEEKKAIASRKSLVDFGIVAGAGEVPEEELRGLAKVGAVAYKSFMIARFKELAADDWQLRKNFAIIADEGLPCLIHAENQVIVDRGAAEAKRLGRVDPMAHGEFRPPIAEAEAASRALMFAEEAGMHLHVCHITASDVVDVLEEAQIRGVDATGETSTNYLLMNEETMKERGPYAKVDPPLRTEADQARLWDALNDGVIDVLASDHAPYTKEEKEKGWKNIFDAPSGGVVIETTLPLMLNAVNDGMIGLERLVEVFSTNPAMIDGVYPNKGGLNIGADADVVIVDMEKPFKIRGEDLKTIQKITPYEGIEGVGAPVMTMLRGTVIYEDGQVIGKPGYGKWLRPIDEF